MSTLPPQLAVPFSIGSLLDKDGDVTSLAIMGSGSGGFVTLKVSKTAVGFGFLDGQTW